ncbi:MAG: GyrI-like domain-containing protein [Anaerolineae bacterium]
MKAEIAKREAFTVVGLKYRGQNETGEDIPRLWRELVDVLEGVENPLDPNAPCGVVDNYEEETAVFDYVAGVIVKDPHHVPLGMTKLEIPEQTWAIFECTLDQLDDTYREIYETWLPQSGYQRAEGPDLEQYSADFLQGRGERAEVRICIPVQEA